MTDIRVGEAWDVYSERDREWVPAVVAKVEDGHATLRYEGTLEFLTVPAEDLYQKPELFRQGAVAPPSC